MVWKGGRKLKTDWTVNTEEAHWAYGEELPQLLERWREFYGTKRHHGNSCMVHTVGCKDVAGFQKEFALHLSVQSLDSQLGFVSLLTCCLKHMCKLARVLLFILFKDDRSTKCCLMSFVDPVLFQKFAHIWFCFLCPLSVDTEFPVSFASYTCSLTHFPPPLILQCPFYPINGRK